MRWLGIPMALFVAAGCSGGRQIVPLLDAAGVPLTPPTTAPLEVVTRSTAVPDPLPIRGSDVAYTDVELALGHAVASATVQLGPHAPLPTEHCAEGGITVQLPATRSSCRLLP